ncbi:MAG: peptidoglycan-binding domain-containing protein [Marinicella sp.]
MSVITKVNAKDRFKNGSSHFEQRKSKSRHSGRAQESQYTVSQSKEKSNLLKYAVILLLLTGIGAGGYYGFDYYQEQQKQQQAWNTAQQTNTIQSYQAYLDQYPNGKNSNEANKQLTQLKAEPGNLTAQVQKLLIKLDYQVPTNGQMDTRTTESIKAFEKSKGLIITGKADQVLLKNLQQAYNDQDAKAWQQALKANSITAYQNYQSNYPDGQYISQVEGKIAQVRQVIADAEAEKQRQTQLAQDKKQLISAI